MENIYLTLGKWMWEIQVCWEDGSCKFGNGLYKFVNDLDISNGDVIAMNIAKSPEIVLSCIFKQEELDSKKETGKRDGRRAFYKVLQETTLRHGYIIGYHSKSRIIYGFEKVIKHFSLAAWDSIHFSFDMDGVLSGRIFRSDGMNIIYSDSGRSCNMQKFDDCFLFEENCRDSNLEMGDTKLMDVVDHGKVPINNVKILSMIENVVADDIDHVIPDVVENDQPELPENEQNVILLQVSKRLIACNMNGRCHGMHIPASIRIGNREWERGDAVIFRTAERT